MSPTVQYVALQTLHCKAAVGRVAPWLSRGQKNQWNKKNKVAFAGAACAAQNFSLASWSHIPAAFQALRTWITAAAALGSAQDPG